MASVLEPACFKAAPISAPAYAPVNIGTVQKLYEYSICWKSETEYLLLQLNPLFLLLLCMRLEQHTVSNQGRDCTRVRNPLFCFPPFDAKNKRVNCSL